MGDLQIWIFKKSQFQAFLFVCDPHMSAWSSVWWVKSSDREQHMINKVWLSSVSGDD